MQVVEPGHRYFLHLLDNDQPNTYMDLVFVKRVGEKYPGNDVPHRGTIIQEVLRACIDRLRYLDKQKTHDNNRLVIQNLQAAILLLEHRAAEQHNRILRVPSYVGVEHFPICLKCGHIGHKCAD